MRRAKRRTRRRRGLLALRWLWRIKDGWETAFNLLSQAVKAGKRAEGCVVCFTASRHLTRS